MQISLPDTKYGKMLVIHTGIGEELDILLDYLKQRNYKVPTRDNSAIEEDGTDACISINPFNMMARHAPLSYYQRYPDMYQIVELSDIVQQQHKVDVNTFQALI